jgi:hypothetical protein
MDESGGSARGSRLADRLLATFVVDIGRDDGGAGGGECARDRSTHSSAGTGDEDDLAVERWCERAHVAPPEGDWLE